MSLGGQAESEDHGQGGDQEDRQHDGTHESSPMEARDVASRAARRPRGILREGRKMVASKQMLTPP